jgi:hypothetical protein
MEVLVPVHFGRMELAGWVADFVVLRFIFLFPVYLFFHLSHHDFDYWTLQEGEGARECIHRGLRSHTHTRARTHTHTFAHPNLL